MSKSPSRRQEQQRLAKRLRAQGRSWVEIARILGFRYKVNPRVALRLAHGWNQRQAAEEWNRRWPDELKVAKNFSYWETWPISGHAPSLGTLDKLARLYACSVADLLVGVSDHRDQDHLEAVDQPSDGINRPTSGPDCCNDALSLDVTCGTCGARNLVIATPASGGEVSPQSWKLATFRPPT